jgi:hypothetical protein
MDCSETRSSSMFNVRPAEPPGIGKHDRFPVSQLANPEQGEGRNKVASIPFSLISALECYRGVQPKSHRHIEISSEDRAFKFAFST